MRQIQDSYDAEKLECSVMKHWEDHNIIDEYMKKDGETWYWCDGPPYVTGTIHLGTAWNKIIKDTVLRYKTMTGYAPTRQPGFDMHGLPIEVKVEETLKLANKKEIETKIGIDNFIQLCKDFAIMNMDKMIAQFKDIGCWMEWDRPYMPIKDEYIESGWYTLKKAWDNGLFFRDKRVTHWCPRCETALAEHEIRGEYKMVDDPSIFVKFKVIGKDDEYLLVWTTTPWTLPANLAVAVHPDYDYVEVMVDDETWIVAEALMKSVFSQLKIYNYTVIGYLKGKDLEGLRYKHPLLDENPIQKEFYEKGERYHSVILGEHVTLEDGTGCVHTAPGFGAEDFDMGKMYGLEAYSPVDDLGRLSDSKYEGLFIKDADPLVIKDLEKKGLMVLSTTINHKYPFCWRCKSPLIFKSTEQWFLDITSIKSKILEKNKNVQWIPDWVHKRYENGVENVGDWCISRQRYWGMPLPIWSCEEGHNVCIGSKEEMERMAKGDGKVKELHRPYVDDVVITCPECGKDMTRVKDIVDVWFDSSIASWASLHYPHDTSRFEEIWPAEFIVEGNDQVTKWFYGQQASSIITFGEMPYKRVQMHGFVYDAYGDAMHKSTGNVIAPEQVVEREGRDIFRFFTLWHQQPHDDMKFSWDDIANVRRMVSILWNVYKFSTTYMVLDDYDVTTGYDDVEKHLRTEDRWLLSRINSVCDVVREGMDEYMYHKPTRAIMDLIVEDLSRWYVRLVRSRTWSEKDDPDKLAVYFTLHYTLLKLSKIFSPIMPFISEEIYLNLQGGKSSVHMEEFPERDDKMVDEDLEKKMSYARKVVEACANARQKAELKQRWPVSEVVIDSKDELLSTTILELESVLKEQVNAKSIRIDRIKHDYDVKPNYKKLGPKFKGDAQKVALAILAEPKKEFLNALDRLGKATAGEYEVDRDDVVLEETLPEGWASSETDIGTVFVNTEITQELRSEAMAREVIRRIQEMRKELDLNVEDSIETYIVCSFEDELEGQTDYISNETRSKKLLMGEGDGYFKEWGIDENTAKIWIKKA
ncbi:MAG TPA: isoleucine--tRNA ligase [Candidatus Methanofastidiosa archaeon]|nr:isoleucine--tRNA ligase [Candidatus Methanofastidiosa archaeon]